MEHLESLFDRSEVGVIRTVGLFASAETPTGDVVGYIEVDHGISDRGCRFREVKRALRLRDGSGKAVQQISASVAGRGDGIADDVNDKVVGNQITVFEEGPNPSTKFGVGGNMRAEQLAARHMRNAEMICEHRALRSLARAWRSEQNKSHD